MGKKDRKACLIIIERGVEELQRQSIQENVCNGKVAKGL
jgi:hypothetical protein